MSQLDGTIASILGRPDLARSAPVPSGNYTGTGTLGLPNTAVGGAAGNFFAQSSSDLLVGRLSLGTLGLVTLGLVGFYMWTREHQAALVLIAGSLALTAGVGGMA